MNKINLLSEHLANLIAAGEVVERPSSALKELLENAVDAGASHITAEIKSGGILYMRVSDNGSGMSREDLSRSVLRHATSKIAREEDLEKIGTLGFRGEALAAIASVSDIKIFTREENAQTGYLLEARSGLDIAVEETGCAAGTTVIVERLFARVPARKKFLRKDMTEAMSCRWTAEKTALANPAVSIKFISDGSEKLFTPGDGKLYNTIHAVFGDTEARDFIPVEESMLCGIKAYGYISAPGKGKSSRSDMNFFINGRYIRSKTMSSAVETAYSDVSEAGKFPMCVLFLSIDERLVDVNVHPQKMEVKFSDERVIFEVVYYTVKNTLDNILKPAAVPNKVSTPIDIPQYSPKVAYIPVRPPEAKYMPTAEIDILYDGGGKSEPHMLRSRTSAVAEDLPETYILPQSFFESVNKIDPSYRQEKVSEIAALNSTSTESNESYVQNYKILGEAFYAYIIVEAGERLVIIDKHAAHERIIYNDLKDRAESSSAANQILLSSVTVELTYRLFNAVLEYKDDFNKIGFVFDVLGGNMVIIREIPDEVTGGDIAEMFTGMAEALAEDDFGSHKSTADKIIYAAAQKSAACRRAMKAGIADAPGHIEWLVRRVMESDNMIYCPHGRPAVFELAKKQIERQFKRT